MKKLLFILLSFAVLSCGGNETTENTNQELQNDANVPEEVEIGAGENRSPQLEFESDSNEIFDVDTVSSAAEIDEQIEQD